MSTISVVRRGVVAGELPAWPLIVLFAGFPIWWLLGFAAFAVVLTAIPMTVLMVLRRRVEIPSAFALYVLFLLWTLASATQLDTKQLVGFAVRFGNMAGCGLLFLYVFNARTRLTSRVIFTALMCFFACVVFGGYLGVFFPHGTFPTLAEKVLPGSIAANTYVQALVHPTFAEIQRPYGSPVSFYRPSAPFPYTNSWGCNMELLLPLAIASFGVLRRRSARWAIAALLALSLVPVFDSLNRGLYLGVGVAAVFVVILLAIRGRGVPLMTVGLGAAVAYAIAVSSGAVDQLNRRLQYSESNSSRTTIYHESFQGAVNAPIFGNGAPRASDTVGVAVGSQGQIWALMFSYGFIALGLFVAWFAAAWWSSRRASTMTEIWVSATLVVAILSFVYYGYDGPQLAVVMVVAALSLRTAEFRRFGSAALSAPRSRYRGGGGPADG